MTQSPFTAGYEGLTRDGRRAGVYWVGKETMHGWIEKHDYERRVASWWINGVRFKDQIGDDDLIPPKPETRTAEAWMTLLTDGSFHRGKPVTTYHEDRIFAVVHLTAEVERGRRDDLKEQK